jgi:hypothetical protein
MTLNRYAARRDANDGEIYEQALKLGWYLYRIKDPADYLGCLKCQMRWYPIEIKSEHGRFTDAQKLFRSDCRLWRMPYLVWHSVDEMIEQTNRLRVAQ